LVGSISAVEVVVTFLLQHFIGIVILAGSGGQAEVFIRPSTKIMIFAPLAAKRTTRIGWAVQTRASTSGANDPSDRRRKRINKFIRHGQVLMLSY